MATITSAASGLSNVGATWVGGIVPIDGDKVIIANTHTVTLTGTHIWGDDTTTAITINTGGILRASRTANSSLTCRGDLIVNGEIDYGKTTAGSGTNDPIPLAISATLILNFSSVMAVGKYGLTMNSLSRCYFASGNTRNPNADLIAPATIGGSFIDVTQTTGWQVGDLLCMGRASPTSAYEEYTVNGAITSIAGGFRVPITPNIVTAKPTGAIVSTFFSNVLIRSHTTSFPGYIQHNANISQAALSREFSFIEIENIGHSVNGNIGRWGALCMANNTQLTGNIYTINGVMIYLRGAGNNFSIGINPMGVRPNVFFRNCAVSGNNSNPAIYIGNGSVVTIEDTYVHNGNTGIMMAYGAGAQYSYLRRVKISTPGQFLNLSGCVFAELNDCKMIYGTYIFSANSCATARFIDCQFGNIGDGLGDNSSAHFTQLGVLNTCDAYFENCRFQSGKIFTLTTGTRIQDASPSTKIVVANKNLNPLVQESYYPGGNITRDTTFSKDAGGSSLKMTCWSNVNPISFQIAIYAPYNKPLTVSGYIYIEGAYDFSAPVTVTLSGLGMTPVSWLATPADVDQWQQLLVAITNTSGSDGMMTLTISARSNAGSIWVDGVSAPTPLAVNSGEFGFWDKGLPAPVVSSNFVSAADLWNTQANTLTLPGSIGLAVNEVHEVTSATGANELLKLSKYIALK